MNNLNLPNMNGIYREVHHFARYDSGNVIDPMMLEVSRDVSNSSNTTAPVYPLSEGNIVLVIVFCVIKFIFFALWIGCVYIKINLNKAERDKWKELEPQENKNEPKKKKKTCCKINICSFCSKSKEEAADSQRGG
jgi:hypothetical protein